MDQDRRPIGYWLKHVDRLIEGAFDRTLAEERLTRRHWQVLNTLQAGPASRAEIGKALEPFLVDDSSAVGIVIDDLVGRGWLRARDDDRLELTEHGERAHALLHQRVTATRQLALRGVTEQEYLALIDFLRRIASNLESAAT